MTVSFGAVGAFASGTTTAAAIGYPTGVAAGNLFVGFVGNKAYSATVASSSMTIGSTGTNGTTAVGVDTGSVRCTNLTYVCSGSESGSATTTMSGTCNPRMSMGLRFANGTGAWTTVDAVMSDTSATGTGVSATAGSTLDIAIGDMIAVCVVIKTDTATSHASQVVAVPGCTVGAVTWSHQTTTQGDDGSIYLGYASITAGSATGAPSYTATATSGQSDCVVGIVRVREVGVAMGGGGGTNLLSGDAVDFEGGTVGDWVDAANETVSVSTLHPHGGTHCMLWTTSGSSGTATLYYPNTAPKPTVVPGQQYTFSYWAYSTAATTCWGEVDWYLNGGYDDYSDSSASKTSVPANTYTLVTQTFTAPAGCNQAVLLPQCDIASSGNNFYTDDFYFGNPPSASVETVGVMQC